MTETSKYRTRTFYFTLLLMTGLLYGIIQQDWEPIGCAAYITAATIFWVGKKAVDEWGKK